MFRWRNKPFLENRSPVEQIQRVFTLRKALVWAYELPKVGES
jgi:hypothetical protein